MLFSVHEASRSNTTFSSGPFASLFGRNPFGKATVHAPATGSGRGGSALSVRTVPSASVSVAASGCHAKSAPSRQTASGSGRGARALAGIASVWPSATAVFFSTPS